MKKSQIVSYTSEELDQLPDESDWTANAAMTDGEIEAAIASDPDENKRSPDWLKRARVVRPKARYVMYINTERQELVKNKVYKVVPDEDAAKRGLIHITDERGFGFLYPANNFAPVELSDEAERGFELEAV
jgi:hypothetical protein